MRRRAYHTTWSYVVMPFTVTSRMTLSALIVSATPFTSRITRYVSSLYASLALLMYLIRRPSVRRENVFLFSTLITFWLENAAIAFGFAQSTATAYLPYMLRYSIPPNTSHILDSRSSLVSLPDTT